MKRLVILGSTGSIGTGTLQVVEHLHGQFEVEALTACRNMRIFAQQIERFKPRAVVFCEPIPRELRALCKQYNTELYTGIDGLNAVSTRDGVDIILNALVGSIGLVPTIHALRSGKTVALANKESMVIGGGLVLREAGNDGSRIRPVDSEHAALHQTLDGRSVEEVKRLWLTASGGALRDYRGPLEDVTPSMALKHPTWNMGRKVTIDSATMMNKGLEIIEAHHLFQVPYDIIQCLIHKQSTVHSLVELKDGSVLAHMAPPDMRGPIQYALTYPDMVPNMLPPLLPDGIAQLDFKRVDLSRYPCLSIAVEAGRIGGSTVAVMNAANEVAVSLFLEEKIGFTGIPALIESILEKHDNRENTSLDEILSADVWARDEARRLNHH